MTPARLILLAAVKLVVILAAVAGFLAWKGLI